MGGRERGSKGDGGEAVGGREYSHLVNADLVVQRILQRVASQSRRMTETNHSQFELPLSLDSRPVGGLVGKTAQYRVHRDVGRRAHQHLLLKSEALQNQLRKSGGLPCAWLLGVEFGRDVISKAINERVE